MTSVVRSRVRRVERAAHRRLAHRVEMRGRLVEDQHRRVLQERAGDGHALALAARELRAALAHHRVEPVGQRRRRSRAARRARWRAASAAVVGVGPREQDVGAQRVVEQVGVLRDQRDPRGAGRRAGTRADRGRRGGPRPRPDPRSAAAGWRPWSCPAPDGPTSATVLPRGHLKRHVVERGPAPAGIGEASRRAARARAAASPRAGRHARPVGDRHRLACTA